MRAPACLLVLLIAGCHPSATVERTMPVANLQSYRTVALRVQSTAFASQGEAMMLESAVLARLQQQCGFERVGKVGQEPADVILDVNITGAGRGGGGFISNPNVATLDTLLVLSDGQNGDLLGTARIHGKSSGVLINNSVPENEAIDVVAKTIGDLLAKSGCTGPRIARVEGTPPPGPNGSNAGSDTGTNAGSDTASNTGSNAGSAQPPGPVVDEATRKQAETLNDQGRDRLRSADINGALAAFQQANSLVPDPRYEFNVCLALETGEHWDQAAAACKQARGMNPDERLAAKIDHRLDLIAHKQ